MILPGIPARVETCPSEATTDFVFLAAPSGIEQKE